MAPLSSYRVAVTNEDWSPLIGIEVEAMNLSTLLPDDVQTTGKDGVVIFTGLPAGPHFFKPRVRRVSTKVGDRTYTGQVRIQVIAMGNQGITKHYVVDANGMGTHTTIQAAVTAAIALGSGFEVVIYCNPGTYSEDLTVPFGATAGAIYLVGEGTVKNLDSGTYNSIVTVQGTTTTDPVMELSGTGSLSAVGIDFKPKLGSSGETIKMATGNDLELNDCKVTSWTVGFTAVIDLRCRNCIISTGGRIIDSAIQVYFEHCYLSGAGLIKGDWGTLVVNDCILLGTAPASEYWIEEDVLVVSPGVYVTKCISSAGGGGGFIKCGDPSAASNDSIIAHNKITLGGGEKGIYLVELTGAVVTDNVIEGANNADSSTAIEIAASAACRACVIAHNSIRTIQNGIVVGANGTDGSCIIGPNAYYDVGANTSGVPAAEDYQVSLSTASCALLDGTIHTDTVAQAVTAGSIIFGNDTPAWDELAIAIPAANVLNVLGVANGETVPSWKTALDGTAPTTIAESAVAAPGTSLIFAHRDHTHGAPATWAATAHGLGSATHTNLVDYSVTLGLASLTIADANFGLSLVSSNPRWTVDSGDYLEYNRAGNYFSFAPGATESLQVGATFLRAVGYARVGSLSAPLNTTAGDLTAERVSIGNGAAFGTAKRGEALDVAQTSVATDTDAHASYACTTSYAPASNSGAYLYQNFFTYTLDAPAGVTLNYVSNFVAQNYHHQTGAIDSLYGMLFVPVTLDTDTPATAGAISNLYGIFVRPLYSSGGSASLGITDAWGIYIDPFLRYGTTTVAFGTFTGICVANPGVSTITTLVGIDIASLTRGTTNIGLRLGGCSTAAIHINTDTAASGAIAWGASRDTNLYRSAANTLKTDDMLYVGTALAVGATGNVSAGNRLVDVDGTLNTATGYGMVFTPLAGAGVTNFYGIYARLGVSAGTVTTGYGLYVANPSGAGAMTNAYGLYIEDTVKGASANYAIYLAGTSGLARQGIWWNADTCIYRGAANRLDLQAGDAFVIHGGAGDFASPVNGMLWYNTTTNKLRVYEGGAWADVV